MRAKVVLSAAKSAGLEDDRRYAISPIPENPD
jgi:hypothetical protein